MKLAWLLTFALLVAACSNSGASDESEPAAFDAVLLELFGTTDTEQYLALAERDAARIVQSCMNAAGFEYELPRVADELVPPAPGSVVDAEAVGFGIIANYRYQISRLDLLVDFGGDPNTTYLSTLPAAEIQRFVVTLDGPEVDPGQRKEDRGCNGTASDQVYADWSRFAEQLPNFTALGEERDTHPDWLAARADWRICMVDRGFDFAEPDVIRADVTTRMREVVRQQYPNGDVPLVVVEGGLELDPAVDALLDELAEFESAAAVANIECAEPLAERFDAVERLVQQEFVDRNQATIDDLIEQNT